MISGHTAAGWEPVRAAFAATVEDDDAGGAFCVLHRGRTVVDLWGGTDPLSGRPWEQDSVTLAFSTAKGVTAMVAAAEIGRGTLDPAAPVARYWPEFAAAGKEAVTVDQVLTHTAGLPVLPTTDLDVLVDQRELAARLAAAPLAYPAGTARIYHVLSYGTLLGELLHRVTGRDLGTLVAERVAGPLRASLWFGQPGSVESRYRPALMDPVERPPVPQVPDDAEHAACWAGYRANDQLTPVFSRTGPAQGSEPFNSLRFRSALVPAGGLVTDARGLARAYAACLGEVDGARLLDDATLDQVAVDALHGVPEPVCGPGATPTTRWGRGFELDHAPNPMLGDGSFGHAGMGGRLGFGHRPSGLAVGYVSQRMRFTAGSPDPRWQALLGAVREVTGV